MVSHSLLLLAHIGWDHHGIFFPYHTDQLYHFILPQLCGAFFFFFFNLCIYFGCARALLLQAGFLSSQGVRATLHCCAHVSHCGGFSRCRAPALGARASVIVACGLSSSGTRAWLPCCMSNLPGPEMEPETPELASRFLTPVPPGRFLPCLSWCLCSVLPWIS